MLGCKEEACRKHTLYIALAINTGKFFEWADTTSVIPVVVREIARVPVEHIIRVISVGRHKPI